MNRYTRPILFAFEPNLTRVFLHVKFGASGAPTITRGKGVCNIARNAIVLAATTANASTAVSALAGAGLGSIYNGMGVTGANIAASTTISAINPSAGTATLSANATGTNPLGLTFSGGQFTVTFGQLFATKLDTYVNLAGWSYSWDDALNSEAVAGSTPASPAAPFGFLIQNQVSVGSPSFTAFGSTATSTTVTLAVANGNIVPGMTVTSSTGDIPAATTVVAVSGTTVTISAAATGTNTNEILTFTSANPASVTLQFGSLAGNTFTAHDPASGEILRLAFDLVQSTAI